MRNALAGLVGAVVVAACSEPAGTTEALCISIVNAHGTFFSPYAYVESGKVSSDVYLTISRTTACHDQGEPTVPVRHAESNYLPVGTTLHEIAGFAPTERLAVWLPLTGDWHMLRALD